MYIVHDNNIITLVVILTIVSVMACVSNVYLVYDNNSITLVVILTILILCHVYIVYDKQYQNLHYNSYNSNSCVSNVLYIVPDNNIIT